MNHAVYHVIRVKVHNADLFFLIHYLTRTIFNRQKLYSVQSIIYIHILLIVFNLRLFRPFDMLGTKSKNKLLRIS